MGIFDKIIAKIRVTKRGQNESENQLPENGKKVEGNLSPEGSTESGMGAVIDGYLNSRDKNSQRSARRGLPQG